MSDTGPGSTEDARKRENIDWWGFAAAGLVLSLTQLGYYLTAAALPLYLRDLGAAQGRIGLEIGLGSMLSLAVTLLMGPAINRYGSVVFVRVGGGAYVLTSLGMVLFPNEVAVTACRAGQALAGAMLVPSAFTLGSRLMPNRHATALGTLGAMNGLALAIGPPVGLVLYTSYGAKGLFIPAIAASALGLLATLLLPNVRPVARAGMGFGFDRSWVPSLASNALLAMYFGGILAYLPLYLRQVHGPNAGIFFSADAVGVLLLRIPTGMLADRSGSFLPKLLGVAVTIPGIAVLMLPPSLLTLIAGGAGTGIGAGLFITGVMGDLARMSNDANRGTAISLGNGSFNGAIFVGSSISGLLIGPGGFDAVLIFGLLTTIAAFPLVLMRGAARGVRAAAA
jgi:MFS family permease